MTNSKNTRRALLTSVMALVLCFAMLTGTTFAWFTDTETSSGNKIVAGNLDVQLLMFDGTNYVDIGSENKPIFGAASLIAQDKNADTLWEPGKTQIAYLAIRNAGNLALKYNVIVDVTDNGLIGALEYAIVPVQGGTADATTLEQSNWANIKDNYENGILAAGKTIAAPNGCLDEIKGGVQNETDFFALVIHMDENAGNEYKEKSVTIDITVNATQVEAEDDAFGPNYDQGLEIVKKTTETVTKDADNKTTDRVVLTKDDVTATVPTGVLFEDDATEATLVVHEAAPYSGITIESDAKVVSLDISVDGVSKDNTTPIEVTLKGILPTDLTSVTLYHNGEPMTGYTYDPATGNVTFSTATFSNFTMVCYEQKEEVKVETVESLADAIAKGGEVTLTADLALEETLTIPAGVSLILDLGGKTLSFDGNTAIRNEGSLVLTGEGKITSKTGYAIRVQRGSLHIASDMIEVNSDFGAVSMFNDAQVTIDGGNYTANGSAGKTHHCIYIYSGADLTINGGTFAHNGAGTSDSGATLTVYAGANGGVTINGGTFTGSGTYIKAFDKYDSNCYINIKGGTFSTNPSNYVVDGYIATANDDNTWTVTERPVSGKVAYRAYVLNGSREAIQIDMEQIYAKESLVIELWHESTLLTTTSYLGSFPCDRPGYTTACVALKGSFLSWNTTISEGVTFTNENIPDTIKVYADGVLTDTFTHTSGTVLADKVNDYLALSSVGTVVYTGDEIQDAIDNNENNIVLGGDVDLSQGLVIGG